MTLNSKKILVHMNLESNWFVHLIAANLSLSHRGRLNSSPSSKAKLAWINRNLQDGICVKRAMR